MRERQLRLPAHQVTTRNLGAAYPFIAEDGLGGRGVVIGDDLLGGFFVFDPFELYAAGIVSDPNMVRWSFDRSTSGPCGQRKCIVSRRRGALRQDGVALNEEVQR
jgi:hypothetical protein